MSGVSSSRFALSVPVLLASAVIAMSLVSAPAASASWRMNERPAIDPRPSVLGYEGVVDRAGERTTLTECTASVIDLPGRGPSIVTARHCEGTSVRVFDDRREERPAIRREIDDGGPDIAVLDLPAKQGDSTWSALTTRPSSSLGEGEILCAFHAVAGPGSIDRAAACGAFVGWTVRLDGGPPALVIAHPFAHGTSGSPVVDSLGRVVGIVSSSSEREGFAEPIEEAIRVAAAPAEFVEDTSSLHRHRLGWPFDDVANVSSLCALDLCVRWQLGG